MLVVCVCDSKIDTRKLDIHLNIWTKEKGRQIVEKETLNLVSPSISLREELRVTFTCNPFRVISTIVALGEYNLRNES